VRNRHSEGALRSLATVRMRADAMPTAPPRANAKLEDPRFSDPRFSRRPSNGRRVPEFLASTFARWGVVEGHSDAR
jgi:hypothetical protein